jgi:replicative DNA helicase
MKKIMPCDNGLENSVLGILVLYPKVYKDIRDYIIDDNVFYQSRAKLLWAKLKEMFRRKDFIDIKTVIASIKEEERLKGLTHMYVVDCTVAAGLSSAAPTYAKKLYEKYLMRRVIEETHKVQDSAINSGEDTYDCIINAHTLFSELIELNPTKEKESIDSLLIDAVQDIQNKDINLIKTGYNAIDKFAGGLTRGEITIIGGRPGHGKTTMMVNMLASLINNGYKVALFNRELPNIEVIKKLICLESQKLSYSLIRQGIHSKDSLAQLEKVRETIKKKYNEENFLMFDNIRDFAKTSAEVKKFKPDVIMDDYIQLVSPDGKIPERRLQLERLVNDYKWLAKQMKCAVILASQLNRGIESRHGASRPQLSDLAESGAIEQVAENVFFVYYDYKINGEDGKGKNIITFVARKVRYGETGESDLGYNGDKCKIFNSYDGFMNSIQRKEMMDEKELPF